jgi:hypothetical protein
VALKINSDLPIVRQYDKVIAVVVLIILLISLFYLTRASAARKRDEANYDLKIKALKPTAGAIQAMDLSAYEAAARLARTPLQLSSLDGQQAGLLTPERRVICVNSACQKPIPFETEACPFCEAQQPPAKPNTEGLDTDKDGIPDKVENALGMNPQDPSDAKGDLDSDGFNNLEELAANTEPKDAKSHPALVNLLRVKELRGKKLPLIFSGVNKMPDGKNQLVFNLVGQNRRTFYVREGGQIGETNSATGKPETDYVAGKAEIKFEERDNPNMPGIKRRVDLSTVVIKRLSDKKELTLGINESGKNTDVEAVIVLPLDNTEYSVLENGTFKVRDETYRVVSVDVAATSAVIENEATGQQKVVRKLD